MHNHAPESYACPICIAIDGVESDATWIKQADIFYRDAHVMGFVSSKFVQGNEGHPILVPIKHSENLYDLPIEDGQHLAQVTQKVAVALKQTRGCDGVTVLQNNEPAGDQHAFHYHVHLFPRFEGDSFHEELQQARRSDPEERIEYANSLRGALLGK